MSLYKIEKKVNIALGKLQSAETSLKRRGDELNSLKEELKASKAARVNLLQIAEETQREVEIRFSKLITASLKEILGPEYSFDIDFEMKGNRLSCEIYIIKNGKKRSPQFSHGGGVVDILSMSTRLSLWALYPSGVRTNPILILDEPFKYVSIEYRKDLISMLRRIVDELDIQIIMTTHIPNITGDRNFKIHQGKLIRRTK